MAKSLGARLTPNSGATSGAKGDMAYTGIDPAGEAHEFLIEAKSTAGGGVSVDLGWLNKIAIEAQEKAAIPALSLEFTDTEGRARRNGSWVAIPLWLFKTIFRGE